MKNQNLINRLTNSQIYPEKGFTLIEMVVATAIFGVLALVASGIFISSVNVQQKVFAMQNSQEIGRYLMESMSKEIRMGAVLASNSFSTDGDSSLNIRNSNGDDVVYSFAGDILTKNTNGQGAQALSPSNMSITGRFYIGQGQFLAGGKVTIVMKAKVVGAKATAQSEINLQNTIAARGE